VWSPLVLLTLQICTGGDHTYHPMMPQSPGLWRSPVSACGPSEAPPTTTSTLSIQDGWMVCGQETLFHCIPHVWQLIMVVTNLLPIHMFLSTYLVGTKCLNYLPTSVFLVRFVI
jgi:hypothetical protein